MRVLVTNDDGVSAPGLLVLAQALAAAGHDLVVAAPLSDNSGASAAIGPVHLTGGVTFQRVELDGLAGRRRLRSRRSARAAPCSWPGSRASAPRPTLVVSGINPGNNTGRAVLHSGTVGAALTAANIGLSGVAVSVGFDGEAPCFDTAAPLAVAAVAFLAAARRPAPCSTSTSPAWPSTSWPAWPRRRLAPFGTVRTVIVGCRRRPLRAGDAAGRGRAAAGHRHRARRRGLRAVTALVRPHARRRRRGRRRSSPSTWR